MNLFALVSGIAALGSNPVRFFDGIAPAGTEAPYATWQEVARIPDNLMDGNSAFDRVTLQLDVWATTGSEARSIARQLRQALKAAGYITAWREEPPTQDSELFRVSFDFSLIETV